MILFFLTLLLVSSKLTEHQRTLHSISKQAKESKKSTVETFKYTVPLDHFNANNDEEFEIVYFIDSQYLDSASETSPIFILLGGEGPETEKVLQNNYVIDELAKKHKGLMLSVEHRFYGTSTPSLELNTLKYCTAEQAMMDYVEVINYVQEMYSLVGHPVIALGGSYSGNLATWIRQKYPNIIDGSWASSAPLEAVVDFYEYLEVVQSNLPENTATLLTLAFEKWDEMVVTESGRKQLGKIFHTCTEFGEKDIQTFSENIGTALAGYVQYNSSVWKKNYESTNSICYEFDEDINTKYPMFIDKTNTKSGSDCTGSSLETNYKELRDTTTYEKGNDGASGRAWMFQTCVAYGYYQAVSEKSNVMFGRMNKLQGSIDMCKDIYNIDNQTLYQAVEHINVRYGAKNPQVTNVAFTNGGVDPWHALGITQQDAVDSSNIVQYIQTTSHCSDLYSEKETDAPELKRARHKEMRFFEELLENLPKK
ncbi:hypothetical protein EIN_281360 [Entamoeba invadens IP1]|uniref:Serine protease n=2 Tax=Entamoeba invadens TaxID=33085 RepID=A0A0A1TWW4_ENTIV|nr:hypothetical protein EIN_281360 [Entamoeba invadens IP1]ELP85775.1 hypothetical protein EIN_281360 [Entamoeba invadens IP1]BAH98106.1 serine protease [Entamoeba invadens]|eukprot:XP_004185121.1 hypothetical protein EIN_281360 [Entamoeba invadens IP1]